MVRSIPISSRSRRSHHNAGKTLKNLQLSGNVDNDDNDEENDELEKSEDSDDSDTDSDATEDNVGDESSDEESDDQQSDNSEISIKQENRSRRRRPSILEDSLNATDIVFPRSDSAIISSDDEHGDKRLDEMNELSGLESGTEFGDDYLLSLLDQEESSDEYQDALTDSDDDKMQEEEEKNILHEVSQDELESSQSPVDVNGVEAKNIEEIKHEDEWDDDEQSEVSFDDDFFEKPIESKSNSQKFIKSTAISGDNPSDDDSYLWSYFFSDGNSDSDIEDTGRQSNLSSPTGRNKTKRRSYSRRSGKPTDFEDDDYSMDGTGESTDEDLTLPPPSHRRAGARATEVLSSSSMAARPPVLGTWVMSPERPSGIIDGLTTRTLSPPLNPVDRGYSMRRQGLGSEGGSRKRNQQAFDDDDDESDLGQLALEEFIYTSELDDSSGDQEIGDQLTTPWNSRIKSDIPLSAFRNRGMQMHHPYNTGSPTISDNVISKRHVLKHRRSKEPIITPVRGLRRRAEMQKQKRSRKYENLQETEYHDTLDASNLIEELVGIGALSPLFNGLA